ncbi:unnamed protein product [Staurois parvus]|uniref:Ig-like domain-containing protein n=1 Tax=Staurois parvus TaxID=386267 RepID=A0ABN9DQ84_9NEOB|nr:unnamed protein product [Staurois parvus]
MMVGDRVTFLCGIPGIQRTGTSLWWVPITGSIYLMMVRDGETHILTESIVSMCLSDDGGSRWILHTALSFTIKSPLTRPESPPT